MVENFGRYKELQNLQSFFRSAFFKVVFSISLSALSFIKGTLDGIFILLCPPLACGQSYPSARILALKDLSRGLIIPSWEMVRHAWPKLYILCIISYLPPFFSFFALVQHSSISHPLPRVGTSLTVCAWCQQHLGAQHGSQSICENRSIPFHSIPLGGFKCLGS